MESGRFDAVPETGTARGDRRMRDVTGYVMKHSYNRIFAAAADSLKPWGLRPTIYSALTVVVENPGLRQSQLAAILNIERSNMVKMVDQLEQLGYIARHRVPSDRRSYALTATPLGETVQKQAEAAVLRDEAVCLSMLSPEERRQLLTILQRITQSARGGNCP